MSSPKKTFRKPRHLPRLPREHYRGRAVVFWTHGIFDRATGWLTPAFHTNFREILLHACCRYSLTCPAYCLMPDHFHLLWIGISDTSDQLSATAFLRKNLRPLLEAADFQDRAHDHILREAERAKDALLDTCSYIFDNPVRAGLVEARCAWSYSGIMVPGYFGLTPHANDWWETFWKCHNAGVTRLEEKENTP